jgi:glycosyltransferase involved in cell wall biosynthesis
MSAVPFFSIIIPVYNRERFIDDAIQSVLDQRFQDFELIIVNDGSTDGTEARVQSFADTRIRYVKIANRERGAARNEGARHAKGTYLNFFDSDDRMYSHHLVTAHNFIQLNKLPRWFHVGYEIRDESGKLILEERGVDKPDQRIIKTNYLGCDSVFIQRSLFQEHWFNEDRRLASSEDWELWLRVISREKLIFCPEVTFRMVQHANRSLHTITPDRIIERDTFMLDQLLQNSAFTSHFKKHLPLFEADRYTFFALCLVVAKRRREATANLWRSFRATPQVLTRKRFWACFKILTLSLVK